MRDLQRINRELNMTTIINLHFLDLARVKPNTLGNTRMIRVL